MKHLERRQLTTQLFTMDWMFTIFSRVFHIKVVRVIWDIFLVFGSYSVIKIALALFKILEKEMLSSGLQDGFNFIKVKTEKLEVSRIVKIALQGDFLDENNFQKKATLKMMENLGMEDLSFY